MTDQPSDATSVVVWWAHRTGIGRPGWQALAVLCTAQVVLQLDFSIVNVALQTIQTELTMDAATLQWIVTGYALTFGSLLLFGGRLGDRIGDRRLLLGGLWVFGAASLACGLATSTMLLIGARAVQGVGAAMIAPTILASLTRLYPDGAARTRALGIWTGANAAGGTVGIVAGGVLTEYLGWRSVFLVNLPVIAALILLVRRVLPDPPGDPARRMDPLGALTVTVALAALIFGLSNGAQNGFASTGSLLAFACAAVSGAAFVVTARTVAAPMVPPSFLAVPVRAVSVLVMLLVGGVFAAYAYFIALYLQRVLGFSEVGTALALLPAPLTLVVTSTQIARRVIGRFGVPAAAVTGLVALAAGQFWFSHVTATSTYLTALLPGLVLTALGGGLVFPAVTIGMTGGVPAADQGLAGGLVPTAQQVGAAIGLAALATVAAARGGAPVDGYRLAYGVASVGAGVTAALVLVASAADRHRRGRRAMLPEPAPTTTSCDGGPTEGRGT